MSSFLEERNFEAVISSNCTCYSTPVWGAEYCGKPVCLSVCLSASISRMGRMALRGRPDGLAVSYMCPRSLMSMNGFVDLLYHKSTTNQTSIHRHQTPPPQYRHAAHGRRCTVQPPPFGVTQNCVPIGLAVPEICSRTDRRTDRRVDQNTLHPYRGGVISGV